VAAILIISDLWSL